VAIFLPYDMQLEKGDFSCLYPRLILKDMEKSCRALQRF
jgi:hypothetical protein